MATLSKKYENLIIYLIGPIEADPMAEEEFASIVKSLRSSGIKLVINPCEQELEKTGFIVGESQNNLLKKRKAGKDEEVDGDYRRIWKIDLENVRKADILIANIPVGIHFVGTTREATYATLINGIDLVRDNFDDEQKKLYEDMVRPGLKKLGWFSKPVYLITPAKTRINGTFVHSLVRDSGGKVFSSINPLIEYLKEKYK